MDESPKPKKQLHDEIRNLLASSGVTTFALVTDEQDLIAQGDLLQVHTMLNNACKVLTRQIIAKVTE